MRHTRLEGGKVLRRAHHPRWAFLPLSGDGAAKSGGRFNRPGVPALYLSFDLATAEAEYRQDAEIADPMTVVSYVSHLPDLVDLRCHDDTWDPLWVDWACDWRQMYVDDIEPPSWALGDMLLAAGDSDSSSRAWRNRTA